MTSRSVELLTSRTTHDVSGDVMFSAMSLLSRKHSMRSPEKF